MPSAAFGEEEIRAHWMRQAEEHGCSPAASWSDHRVIELEIDVIGGWLASGQRVLDVGCANGYSSVRYAVDRGVDLTGIDYVPKMIEAAEARRVELEENVQARLRFEVGDVRQLQFLNASFDRVISTRVIINLASDQEQERGLHECARVLRPGGILLVSEATVQGWERLNRFRVEWGLDEIGMPKFNRYLDVDQVSACLEGVCRLMQVVDFASSYYVATRVFKPLLASCTGWGVDPADPDAEFNRWAAQLPPGGDYGTQKLLVFEKR